MIPWFEGGIGEAIQKAKSLQKVFVVVVLPSDESETKVQEFLKLLDENWSRYLSDFVAIKVVSGTTALTQFSQIYPVLILPSIYFIDSASGVDIEVTGGELNLEKLKKSIEKVDNHRKNANVTTLNAASSPPPPEASSSSGATAAAVTPVDVQSPRAERVQSAKESLNQVSSSTSNEDENPASSSSDKESLEVRVERAKKLLAERQANKAKEEKEKEINSEKERRELGKNLQKFKEEQNEQMIKKQAEERRKEKEEERLAREKVKAQIARDREERAEKYKAAKNLEEMERERKRNEQLKEEAERKARLTADRASTARIQFRFPDGRSVTHNFDSDSPLSSLYDYVRNETKHMIGNSDEFSLSTSFPRMELDKENSSSTLKSLTLAPSATVLVLPKVISTSSSGDLMSYVWLLLTPLTVIWSLIQSFFNGNAPNNEQRRLERKRPSQDDSSSSTSNPSNRPQTAYKRRAGVKREGNIGRLSNADDDDDTNTYNGNSTQQM